MTHTKFIHTAVLLVFLGSVAAFPESNTAQVRSAFFTTSDGARIHYLSAGQMTPEPPIVFIPGFTLTASLWERQLREFSSSRLTIAPDPRSQGESSIMLSGNTPERRAIDLHELTTSLHIARFVIVGWSQGAQDVAAYIEQYGTNSLAGVVFVDSVVSSGPAAIGNRKEFSQALMSRFALIDTHPDEYSEGLVRSIFHKPHPDLDMQHMIDESKKTPPSIRIAMLVMDFFGADRSPALKKINCPTLVISSGFSPELTEQKAMVDMIPGARSVVLSDAGHALFIDDPEKFDQELTRLLQAASR